MSISPLAGKPAPASLRIDVARLLGDYHDRQPDFGDPRQRVHFGTSGHRGTPPAGTFNEAHILAITQAVCDYRREQGIDGPLLLGKDTHALSAPVEQTALTVLAANGVETRIAADDGVTPVPVVSRAIVVHNRGRRAGLADGLIATPSHNPPADGGFKYNPPHGGPADTAVTGWIERRANELLAGGNREVRRQPLAAARAAATTRAVDFVTPYVEGLAAVVDMEAIRGAGLRLAVDPLGGSSLPFWDPINRRYGLAIEVVNRELDPTFGFMPVDHDGQIRMDCSSPYAMANLLRLKDRFALACGNDPDADRHGIVTPDGLMDPNHYLAVAVRYLLGSRPLWPAHVAVGKTVVTSGALDRVAAERGRAVFEVPVGFKWFAEPLAAGRIGFGGEESAGATLLQRDGAPWTTDKDGLVMDLLAAEMLATTGRSPSELHGELTRDLGASWYRRLDAPATPAEKQALLRLTPGAVTATRLAGEPIVARLTRAPGNDAPIEGLKVTTASGWFAARPSGTEDIYKIYAESFRDEAHLDSLLDEARQLVSQALGAAAASG
jgi:phosphoglucomutase